MNSIKNKIFKPLGSKARLWFSISSVLVMLSIILFLHISFSSYWTVEFRGFVAAFLLVCILPPLLVLIHLGWIIYSLKRKHHTLCILTLLSALVLCGIFVSVTHTLKIQYERELAANLEKLSKIKGEEYSSKNLGVSFSYLSSEIDSPEKGIVQITENADGIFLQYSHDPEQEKGFVGVFNKNPKQKLVDFLEIKYKNSYPECEFSAREPYYFDNEKMEVVTYFGQNFDACPNLFDISWGDLMFVSDPSHPEKYAFIASPFGSLKAYKANNEKLWYHSLKFSD